MVAGREYKIPFVGLKEGLHHFNFTLDEAFFNQFPDSLIKNCRLFADISFEKKSRLFILSFDFSGVVATSCDRCGEDFDLPLHGLHTLYVKLTEPEGNEEEDIDVVWLDEHASEVDLNPWLYEYAHLSIPFSKVHPDLPDGSPGCDPAILALLGNQKDDTETTDPRWDKLKNLNN
jgi:uncharacterized metal-binding protein YceD (DUF177 family)